MKTTPGHNVSVAGPFSENQGIGERQFFLSPHKSRGMVFQWRPLAENSGHIRRQMRANAVAV